VEKYEKGRVPTDPMYFGEKKSSFSDPRLVSGFKERIDAARTHLL